MIHALYIALSLLLLSFLSALEHLSWMRALSAGAGSQPWLPELVLAALVAGLFVYTGSLKRRLLHPRRGQWLLAAGIACYALGVAVATGLLARGAGLLAGELGAAWARVPELVALLHPQPVLVVAQLLLAFGAFRALANLVPPHEFAEDF
ncbi:hypothetical protein LZ009_19325 [Ramlibacter sp. XY19]|uniref:hypothetical protein n=1 Tax=Ramlibacter paludis TaxID=2908000 RepID=UPI0023DC862A|nr:hypothetical protein [Ramlibacter paludis]MCG2594935.1 hypothetical protein [Ramlibacter paludis]